MAATGIVDRRDWIAAGVGALRTGGIDAVTVEALARELRVTKGSFYWHFADRGALLDELLGLWERETDDLIADAQREAVPLNRVLWFFELVVRGRGQLPDMEYFSWARRDARVARRADATESKRIAFIRNQLVSAGLHSVEAARRAEVAYLSTLGWIERRSRNPARSAPGDLRRFTDHLFCSLFDGIARQHRPTPAMWRRRASGGVGRIGSRRTLRSMKRR